MIERSQTFEVGDRIRIDASTLSGGIVVSTSPPGSVAVLVEGAAAEDYQIEQRGDMITVARVRGARRRFGGDADVHVEVPAGAALALACTSGDIIVNTAAGEVDASVASGDIRLETVDRNARLKSASGDIFVDRVGERLDVSTASGTIRIGEAARDLAVASASGDTFVDRIGETASVRTASGDVEIACFDGTDLRVRTLSGDVRIGIPRRRLLDFDLQTLSGELRNRLPEGDGSPPERSVSLQLETVSGDVTLQGA